MAALFGRRRRALEKPTLLKKCPGRAAQEEYSLGPSVCYEGLAHSRDIMGNQICSSFRYQFTLFSPHFSSLSLCLLLWLKHFATFEQLIWTVGGWKLNSFSNFCWNTMPITLFFSSLNKKAIKAEQQRKSMTKKKTKIQIICQFT